jgi:hypothetical protein
MSMRFFDIGREKLADDADWNTDTFKIALLDLSAGGGTDTMVKAITGATTATPIVATCTAHGFANGDIVAIYDVGGNTIANGVWQVANQATNTFELKTVDDGLNSVGVGAYTSGGKVINLSAANRGQIDAAENAAAAVTLGSATLVKGVLDAADPSFAAVSGAAYAWYIYKSTGSAATDIPIFFNDGKQQVVAAADAASSATTIWCNKLAGPIASGQTVVFSNGVTATLSGAAVAGDRKLTVSAISGAIAAGHTGEAVVTGAGFPFTGGGGAYGITFDNGANKIAKL